MNQQKVAVHIGVKIMFERDKDLIFCSLNMWANYIETGDVTVSAKESIHFDNVNLNVLSIDQMKLIIRIRELADKAFKY